LRAAAPPFEARPTSMAPMMRSGPSRAAGGDHGVTIEAQFKVGEYEVVILSARDSAGLDTWLRQEKYKIPAGSEPLLRPYVQGGASFSSQKSMRKRYVSKMAWRNYRRCDSITIAKRLHCRYVWAS
jgi:hypothetical protein